MASDRGNLPTGIASVWRVGQLVRGLERSACNVKSTGSHLVRDIHCVCRPTLTKFCAHNALQHHCICAAVARRRNGNVRGDCSKMPRVSKMPTHLKTYCKLQICILVVSLYVSTSREPSCAVMFRNSRYFRDYSICSILTTLV